MQMNFYRHTVPLLSALFCLGTLCSASLLYAADIKLLRKDWNSFDQMRNGACNVLISGSIKKGDTDRLHQLVEFYQLKSHPGWGLGMGHAICLDSSGGNYSEGVKLAKYFSNNKFGTIVPNGAKCLSACALAFMGGNYADDGGGAILRSMHINASLGFHRPFLDIPSGDYNQRTVLNAYNAALLAIQDFLAFAMTGAQHAEGSQLRVKTSLVHSFLGFDRNDFFYIDTLDKAGRWDIGLHGYKAPELTAEALTLACVNMYRWQIHDASAVSDWIDGQEYTEEIRMMRQDTHFRDQASQNGGHVFRFDMTVGMGDQHLCQIERYETKEFGISFVIDSTPMPTYAMVEPAMEIRYLPPDK